MKKRVLAFDFGASSGRAILATFDGKKIDLKEVHRFSNDPVSINGTVYWDIQRLFFEIKQGMVKAKEFGGFEGISKDYIYKAKPNENKQGYFQIYLPSRTAAVLKKI